jgi:AcrR family transcriptional regulator
MAEPRRPRAATAEKRSRLLDATEQIMLRDGYAAVTSRRVEAEAGLKLHYHFGTLDDLFVEVFRRRAERNVERMRAALTSAEPLRAWWRLASDPRGTALLVELTAAANHRAALQAEVAKLAHDVRRMQVDALAAILDEYGIDTDEFPPALVAAAVQGLALVIVEDQVRGFDTGSGEAAAAMARLVQQLEDRRAARRTVDSGEPVS